jgi:hypothetical protein
MNTLTRPTQPSDATLTPSGGEHRREGSIKLSDYRCDRVNRGAAVVWLTTRQLWANAAAHVGQLALPSRSRMLPASAAQFVREFG